MEPNIYYRVRADYKMPELKKEPEYKQKTPEKEKKEIFKDLKIKEVAIDSLTNQQLSREASKLEKKTASHPNSMDEDTLRDRLLAKIIHSEKDVEFKQRVLVSLSDSSPSEGEKVILFDMLNLTDDIDEMLRGAHIRVDDKGKLYKKWKDLEGAHERISSHPHVIDSKQYGIRGPWFHEILFGIVEEEGKKKTFLQFENTPWSEGLSNRVGHSKDAIKYVLTGKNVGPYGMSEHVDKNPLHIRTKPQTIKMKK